MEYIFFGIWFGLGVAFVLLYLRALYGWRKIGQIFLLAIGLGVPVLGWGVLIAWLGYAHQKRKEREVKPLERRFRDERGEKDEENSFRLSDSFIRCDGCGFRPKQR